MRKHKTPEPKPKYGQRRWLGSATPPGLYVYNWTFAMTVADEGFSIRYTAGDFDGDHFFDRDATMLMMAVEVEDFVTALMCLIAASWDDPLDPVVEAFISDRIEMALIDDRATLDAMKDEADGGRS